MDDPEKTQPLPALDVYDPEKTQPLPAEEVDEEFLEEIVGAGGCLGCLGILNAMGSLAPSIAEGNRVAQPPRPEPPSMDSLAQSIAKGKRIARTPRPEPPRHENILEPSKMYEGRNVYHGSSSNWVERMYGKG